LIKGQFGIPEIFEDQAIGSLNLLYKDIKFVLKVPIVNFIFRTLAQYEQFLTFSWQRVRPNMLTVNMEKAAGELRYPTVSFQAPKVEWENYYPRETIETIRNIVFTFNYVNTKLLLISIAWEESLGHRPVIGNKNIDGFIHPGIIEGLPPINLVHIPSAPIQIQQLLMDIIYKHHAYDAASDYRALANFPVFLDVTWSHIRKYVGTNEYVLLSNELKEKARELVHERMPFPVTITPESLYSTYLPREVAGIMGIVSMFSGLLTGLVIEGECFRKFLIN
jgi:hypothetical protein